MKTMNTKEEKKEFKYRMNIRPFGIGCQPDGCLRHEEDGTPFGVVVYSHPLSRSEVENFTLAPLTEAKELEGNIYGITFGETVVTYQVIDANNGMIQTLVNDVFKMSFKYHEFLDKIACATLLSCGAKN